MVRITPKEAQDMMNAYSKVYAPKEARAMYDAYAKMYAPKEEPKVEAEPSKEEPAKEPEATTEK